MKQGDCKFYFFMICNLVEEVPLCDFESMWYRNCLVLQFLFKGFILVCVCDFLLNVKRYEHDFTSKPIGTKLLDVGNVNLLPLNLFLSCLKMVVVVFFNKGEIMSVVGTNDMKSLNVFMWGLTQFSCIHSLMQLAYL